MTTLSTRHLPSGETAVLSDGTRIGTMVRATRKVASPRGERPCVGFLIADLAGAEIAWGSTYRFAVQRVIHEIEDANRLRPRLPEDGEALPLDAVAHGGAGPILGLRHAHEQPEGGSQVDGGRGFPASAFLHGDG